MEWRRERATRLARLSNLPINQPVASPNRVRVMHAFGRRHHNEQTNEWMIIWCGVKWDGWPRQVMTYGYHCGISNGKLTAGK